MAVANGLFCKGNAMGLLDKFFGTWIALLLGLVCSGAFVVGIVVVMVLVATRKSRSGQTSFSCPGCGQRVEQFAESCPHCGRVLLESPES